MTFVLYHAYWLNQSSQFCHLYFLVLNCFARRLQYWISREYAVQWYNSNSNRKSQEVNIWYLCPIIIRDSTAQWTQLNCYVSITTVAPYILYIFFNDILKTRLFPDQQCWIPSCGKVWYMTFIFYDEFAKLAMAFTSILWMKSLPCTAKIQYARLEGMKSWRNDRDILFHMFRPIRNMFSSMYVFGT